MIATLFALVLIQQDAPNPSKIVSAMLAAYHEANRVTGTIKMSQTAMGKTLLTETQLQFEKPSKLYIKQSRGGSNPMTWLATSDGKLMSYDIPNDLRDNNWVKDRRLVESLKQGETVLELPDIYRAVVRSLGDRSAPLDIAIGRLEDLKFLRGQWATVEYGGKILVDGEEMDSIKGKWREYADVPASGSYELIINSKFELRRYSIRETVQFRVDANQSTGPQEILSVWEVRIGLNAKPDASLFKIIS